MFTSRNREDSLVEGFLSVVREQLAYQRPQVERRKSASNGR